MEKEELNFLGDDPGAAKYGNFINYYTFHSAKQRIDNLNKDMFPGSPPEEPLFCLDIGCNTGELSKELYSYIKNIIYPNCEIHMLAIDIDPQLIKRAQEDNNINEITFTAANVMKEIDQNIIKTYLESNNKKYFDITFCFSVTMWIHINNGDDALQNFLTFIKDISSTIVIEPQPWHCYRNAQRRMKKSGSFFPFYEMLKIRSNVDIFIEDILSSNTHKKVFESTPSSWNRKIQSYVMVHKLCNSIDQL